MTSIERLERTPLRQPSDSTGRWSDARSRPARASDLKRIEALGIPPARTDVCEKENRSSGLTTLRRRHVNNELQVEKPSR